MNAPPHPCGGADLDALARALAVLPEDQRAELVRRLAGGGGQGKG